MKKSYTGGAQMGSQGMIRGNSTGLNGAKVSDMARPSGMTSNPGGYMPERAPVAEGPVPLPGIPAGSDGHTAR